MKILVGGQKGGSGKTNLATNLAVYWVNKGHDLILLDTDKAQNSSAKWAARRAQIHDVIRVNCTCSHDDIRHTVNDLAGRYELIIIDAGGSYSHEFRTGLTVADKCLIPFVPSRHDIDTLPLVNDTINQIKVMNPKLKAFAVPSNCPQNVKARKLRLEKHCEVFDDLTDIELLNMEVVSRIAYTDTADSGYGVTEMKDKQAAQEITNIARSLYGD